jgi:transcriptional regulator with XRE-family HTH domain
MRRDELADFLRTRRERLTPADVGLPPTARRRVRGLRREEVAELAEIGIAWYTSLEQGRLVTVSAQTLDGIASALRLTADERIHIFLLAGLNPPLASTGSDVVSPTLQTIVHSLHPQPAYVTCACWDLLAWNDAAVIVFGDFAARPAEERNLLWLTFVDPRWRALFGEDWEPWARCVLNQFRAEYGRRVSSDDWNARVESVRRASATFRRWWAEHEVSRPEDWRKLLRHPTLGTLSFDCLTLQVQAAPTLRLSIYTPALDTDTREKMRHALC